MIFNLAPAWAASAMGIHVTGDADLPDGIHFRLAYSPLLGFPLHPVPVYRSFANSLQAVEIDWFDSRGHALPAAPLPVVPDNPITGYLNLDVNSERGLWLRIDVEPGSQVVVEILANRDVVATRNQPPYSFGGSHLSAVRVRGKGIVKGWAVSSRWSQEQERDPIQMLALPAPADGIAPLYVGVPDADNRAEKRVLQGIPRRFGRHEEFLGLAGPFSGSDELERIRILNERFKPLIGRAINPPTNVSADAVTLREVNGGERFDVNPYGQLATSSIDPVVARWLGFIGSDDPPIQDPERQAYVAHLVWAVQKSAGWQGPDRFVRVLERLPAPADPTKPETDATVAHVLQALAAVHRDGDLHDRLRNLPAGWEWRSLALPFVVARQAAPDVRAPQFAGTPTQVGWTPGTFGVTATFGAVIPLQPQPTSGFSLTRNGTTTVALNPTYHVHGARLGQRAAAIVLGNSANIATPVLTDRQIPAADAGHTNWQLAEMDAFGRWSDWTNAVVPAIDRPLPPAPVLQVRYAMPSGIGAGPLSGTFEIVVEVPDLAGLSPGGQPVQTLEFKMSWGNFARAVAPGNLTTIDIPGPELQPAETKSVTLSAVFVDLDGRRSPPSAPLARPIADPRPPVSVVIPRTLRLTGRRDANGLAHAELTWPTQAGQAGYRIFFASEAALRAALARPDLPAPDRPHAATLLAALKAVTTRADRAGLIVDQKDLFPRKAFELLTAEPVSGGRFVHALSGSLADVAFYRIVAVGSQGVECDFANSALAAVGVPDDRHSAVPILNSIPNRAGVVISIPAGPEPVAEYRIRRTRIGLSDPRSLRIVSTGNVPLPAAPGLPQSFEWLDAEQPEFVRVTYVAEVRYAREPGTAIDREWSGPSNPITWVSLPPSAPPVIPQGQISLQRVGQLATLRIVGVRPPDWDRIGATRLEAYRQLNDGTSELLADQNLPVGLPGQEVVLTDPNTLGVKEYHLVLVDPIGRASKSSVVSLL